MNKTLRFFFLLLIFLPCIAAAQIGWVVEKSGTTNTLRSISTRDGLNAVAVGDTGIITTSDYPYLGGKWRVQNRPTMKTLYGVTSVSPEILVAVGPRDSIFRST